MYSKIEKRWWVFGLLVIFNILIWYGVIAEERKKILTVTFLNIGQGDAIFIQTPNGNQMMIDGGPGKVVLSELGKVMPFYDRSIDLLLVTNPDKDHMGGFIDVLRRYKVEKVIEPGTFSETGTYSELERSIEAEPAERIIALRGMDIVLGENIIFHVFFPDRDISGLARNEGSLVGKLTYGDFSILFTGDTTKNVERYLVELDGRGLESDILKVAHHGSKTATSEELASIVKASYGVISSSKDNTYGHPHKETLDTLAHFQIKPLNTGELGRITVTTDGNSVSIKTKTLQF